MVIPPIPEAAVFGVPVNLRRTRRSDLCFAGEPRAGVRSVAHLQAFGVQEEPHWANPVTIGYRLLERRRGQWQLRRIVSQAAPED